MASSAMESVKLHLLTALMLSFVCLSYQQGNTPQFVTSNGVDGSLKDRLTNDGITEELPPGTSVGVLVCEDKDPGDRVVGYGVLSSQTLTVNQLSGEVTTRRKIDRDQELYQQNRNSTERVTIKVFFTCWDTTGLTATVEIDMTVNDVNDNTPKFVNGPYGRYVPENTAVGTEIYKGITIQDADFASNARVNVTCLNVPGDAESIEACKIFSVQTKRLRLGEYSSSLFLNQPLDYENKRGYTITLQAIDLPKGGKLNLPRNSTVNVLVTVTDNQDTDPVFLNVPLTIYVRENVPVNTKVQFGISAQDGDQGNPRRVLIRMKNDTKGLFRLGNSVQTVNNISVAQVFVNAGIDREQLQGTYEFEVEAIELDAAGQQTNARTSSKVRVDVLDENDNLPTFSSNIYNISLFEIDRYQENFQVPDLNIQITDRDIPSNAKYNVTIARQSQNTFKVFPTGEVVGNVAVNLEAKDTSLLDYDRPELRQQIVILEARETGTATPKTSTATVIINLLDLNDNSPIFTAPTYRFQYPENTPIGTTITTVQASDQDEGLNGKISYSLSGTGSDQFNIDNVTGVVTLARQLDYESNKIYQILVEASDHAQPPRKTSKTFRLDVTNINDEPPRPVRTIYQTYALETNTTLRPAVLVRAVDSEDPSSVITYSIVAGNTGDNAFRVNARSGELTLSRLLDYDETPKKQGYFEIVIQASDNGNPAQYANMTVRVDVQDENNNQPIFERVSYFANISEIAQEDKLVASVSASDQDSGENGRIRYTIQSGGQENFDINQNSGVIKVSDKAKFDRDITPEYNMIVYAIDYGSPPKTGTATVRVEIKDANNKPPTFTRQIYVISISEGTAIGSSVLNVTATDPDTTENLMYTIPTNTIQTRKSGRTVVHSSKDFDYVNAFVVEPYKGFITTNRTLNRALAAEISFNVVVQDMNAQTVEKQTATTSVLIYVLGTNVSTIFFTPPRYYFSVTEGKSKGYVITTVAARDPACGNCLVTNYMKVLTPGTVDKGYLEVDRTTGQVRLSKPIDYEIVHDRQLFMQIEARAADGRTGLTTVVVEVRDDNDNSPVFRQDYYEFSVSESRIHPYRVGYVKAFDKDSGSFGKVEYSISGQGAADFQIFESGLIIVSQTAVLDYEKIRVYNMLVTGSDNPTNQTSTVRRQTSVPLQINILDVNDNTPVFSAIYPFYVVENFEIGQSVGRVIATDGDAGTNGEVFFSMNDTSKLFRITNTGYILTRQSLRDQSPRSPFFVTVRAEDRGQPSLFKETKVEINVRSGQLDDGRPQWSIPRRGEVFNVRENVPEVQFVVKAHSTARSSGPEVIYSFSTESEDHLMFRIDPVSGNITTFGEFDREKQAVYDLILIATDKYNTTLKSYRGLTVRVLDDNDNVPDFGKCPGVVLEVPQRVTIPENIGVGKSVYTVRACDLDEKINGVYYREETQIDLCKREMTGEFFKVDNKGVITTNKPLDREAKAYHLVCVRAFPLTRRKRQADTFNRTAMVETGQVAYVVIKLSDTNDNGPIFRYDEKQMFEAVASVPTVKQVVRVVAADIDTLPFNRVRYTIKQIIYDEPGYRPYALPGSFIIGPDTGIVSVNFPTYSDFRIPNSYFNITIEAEDFLDPSMKDTMNLYVFIFEPSQTLRVVIDKSPDKARGDVDKLISDLKKADTNSMYKLQQISYHRVIDQFDVTRTDVCFVVVKNNKVLSVREGGNTLSAKSVEDVLKKYGARSPGSCYRNRSSLDKIDWAPLWWVLVALAIFIFICCCILIGAIYVLHRNYKRYMGTRKTYLVPQ